MADDTEFRKRNEIDEIAGFDDWNVFGDVDEPICSAQAGDQSGAVTRELVDAEGVAGLLENAAPEFAAAGLAIRERKCGG